MENLKVRKFRLSPLTFPLYSVPIQSDFEENEPNRSIMHRFIDKVKLFLHYIPSCIGGKRISYAAWKGFSFERDEKRKEGKLTHPSRRLILFHPPPPRFIPTIEYTPSIALWESKDVFRENEKELIDLLWEATRFRRFLFMPLRHDSFSDSRKSFEF